MKKFLSILILCTYLCLPIAVFAQTDPSTSETVIEDQDNDSFSDDIDNCPTVRNEQYDGNGNGIGIACDPQEQEDFFKELQANTAQTTNNANHGNIYAKSIQNFEECMGVNRGEVCSYNLGGERDFVPVPTENSDMRDLYEGLINNKITTLLEEPIGNDNIYKRARVCETTFLKDKNGLLQFRNGGSYNPSFNRISDQNLEEIKNKYTTNIETGTEVLITLGKCEEYFVKKCTPSLTETNNRFAKIGDPLPVKVFCDRVQVLFSTSGSDLVKNYVGLIYRWASGFVGIVAVLVIIINGIRISASNGDQSAVESARDSIVKSLTSIAILFLAGILLYSINPNFFTDTDLQTQENTSSESTPTNTTPTQ